MRRHFHRSSRFWGLPLALTLVPVLATSEVRARTVDDDCSDRELEYVLAARLRLTDTPHGAGDGTYDAGPGRVTLRVTESPGSPGFSAVELRDYELYSRFTVRFEILFWDAKAVTTLRSRAGVEGVGARGVLSGNRVEWLTSVQGHTTDGVMTCNGSACGKLGAPEEGVNEFQIGPEPVQFAPFEFSPELDTFQMVYAKFSATEEPKQTGYVSLAGRKVSERCLQP